MRFIALILTVAMLCGFTYGYINNPSTGKLDKVTVAISSNDLPIFGNASTAKRLSANGTNCSAGQSALGIDASGNAEGCFGVASGSGTSTGTNTGDQTITLTGDATGSGMGSFAVSVGKINGVSPLVKPFTPVLHSFTVTGSPILTGKYAQVGDLVTFLVTINPNGGTVASVGGTSYITGAPSAVNGWGTCFFMNAATGTGYVSGISIVPATWAATSVTTYVSGFYWVN